MIGQVAGKIDAQTLMLTDMSTRTFTTSQIEALVAQAEKLRI